MAWMTRSVLCGLSLFGCKSEAPQEPAAAVSEPSEQLGSGNRGRREPPPGNAMGTPAAAADGTPDPKRGVFTLDDATAGLAGAGPLMATIDTSNGSLSCKLFDDKAPLTVANFVGLARGTRPWRDTKAGTWVTRPAYDGTVFHRIIKGFMIQGGDALGNGSGEPGYVVKDELWQGGSHDRAGLLCMANRGPNTNGAQFFITEAPVVRLDGSYTIFGECSPEATVHAIASVPLQGERPVSPVVIRSIVISRGTASAAPAKGPPKAAAAPPAGQR